MIGTIARPNGRGLQDAHGKHRTTYLCDWCGIEKVPHSGRASRVCIDCRHYETFAARGGLDALDPDRADPRNLGPVGEQAARRQQIMDMTAQGFDSIIIGHVLGMSPVAVRSVIKRARAKQRRVEPRGDEAS